METWLFWTLIVFQVIGMIAGAYMIGRKREPLTVGAWFTNVLIGVLIIVALFVWGNPQ